MPLSIGEESEFDICLSDQRTGIEYYFKGLSRPSRRYISDDAQNIYLRAEGKKIGDFDEQRSWQGGRGNEYFSEDSSGFFDSNCWTLGGFVLLPLKWRFGTVYRTVYSTLADSVSWRSLLTDTSEYVNLPATTGAITADACWLWIRRRGTPSDLTLELCSDTAGEPGSVLKTVTLAATDISDTTAVFHKFDWTTTQALSAATTYHIKVYGGANSDESNHWDVGVDASGSSSTTSGDGSKIGRAHV